MPAARLSVSVALATLVTTSLLATASPRRASAQSDKELNAARVLFTDAVKDQAARRTDAALEKFRRVLQVRDTAQVRFRIGACLEEQGHLRDARESFLAATTLAKPDPATTDVVRAAREEAAALERRLAHLTLTLSARASNDAQVTLDGAPLDPSSFGQALLLDPGTHDVTGAASSAPPFRTQVVLSEAASVALVVGLDPAEAPATSPAAAEPTAASPRGPRSTALGLTLVVTGGVLVVGAVGALVWRASDIDTLKDACPGGVCPSARRDELSSARSRALVMEPLAIGLAAGGVGLAAVGSYLLLKRSAPPTTVASRWVAPWVASSSAGMNVGGAF